jgi:hypothetical protein
VTASVTSIASRVEEKSNKQMSNRLHGQAEQIATLRRLIEERALELQLKQIDGVDYLMLSNTVGMLRKAFAINKGMALGENVDELV